MQAAPVTRKSITLDAVSVNLYTALIRLRNQELATHWARYNVMAVANLGLLAAVHTSSVAPVVSFGFCIFGLVLGIAWLRITIYGKRMLTGRWEGYLIAFEDDEGRQQATAHQNCQWWPMFKELAMVEGRMAPGKPLPPEKETRVNLKAPQFVLPIATICAWLASIVLTGVVILRPAPQPVLALTLIH